ncbi:hypothetical protein QA640_35785 [Bradyrhizobium sp. CB82]|uniref:hypothetical protein n=1 Tax=Bradyrhizobium sp. CB82 TaxID=3039159 RepID=UPI0024B0E0EA|nr:hypothetical protein [Bradyrhizobium sp. CB82]WFU39667.1 hypothetical protein QA640_35785 [Bradyrhizobium sp. CB82]
MAEKRPNKEFGKRRPQPLPLPPKEPVKRSGHVALLVMGTIAVGTTAYTLMPRQNCDPPAPGMAEPAQPNTACTSRSSSGSGGHWSSRSSFFSSDSSSHSSSGGSSDSGSGGVTRGGFGSFAHAFGFSGRG